MTKEANEANTPRLDPSALKAIKICNLEEEDGLAFLALCQAAFQEDLFIVKLKPRGSEKEVPVIAYKNHDGITPVALLVPYPTIDEVLQPPEGTILCFGMGFIEEFTFEAVKPN